MNTLNVARNQGEDSQRSGYGVHDTSASASAWYDRNRWRTTMFVRSIIAIVVITGTLTLMGCLGGDDDTSPNREDISGQRTSDFRNVMPVVNERNVVFPGGVMGAANATLRVLGFDTCVEGDCDGTFTLTDGDDGSEGEGDSGGETSCFFLFLNDEIQQVGTQIDCGTCDLQIVGDCVVKQGKTTVCQAQWLLAVQPDDPNPATSTPFDVEVSLDLAGNIVVDGVTIIEDGT